MRDLLTEGIPVLDFLEILPSTGKVGEYLSLDQSSVSRIYRQVSEMLGLEIVKNNGRYSSTKNLEILNSLRGASQALRLYKKDFPIRVLLKPLSLSAPQEMGKTIHLIDYSFGLNWGMQLLKEKIIDIYIADGFEVLPEDWNDLQITRFAIGDLVGGTLLSNSIQLATHPDHPLQSHEKLSGREFWSYPSVAVSNNLFPRLSKALISNGLWQDHCEMKKYSAKNWEGKTRDRKHIAYVNSFTIKQLQESIKLQTLNYDLNLKSCEVALIHRDNLENPRLNKYFACLKDKYDNYCHI